jgi:hypothetical protein
LWPPRAEQKSAADFCSARLKCFNRIVTTRAEQKSALLRKSAALGISRKISRVGEIPTVNYFCFFVYFFE